MILIVILLTPSSLPLLHTEVKTTRHPVCVFVYAIAKLLLLCIPLPQQPGRQGSIRLLGNALPTTLPAYAPMIYHTIHVGQ